MGNRPVIFYGAGEFARILFSAAAQITPPPPIERAVCFADGAPQKWGGTFNHNGVELPIMSLSEALDKYPDARIWIALGKKKKREVLRSFAPELRERVINQPVVTRLGCVHLNNKLEIMNQGIGFCCWNTFQNVGPFVHLNEECDYGKLVDDYLEMRRKIVQGLNDPDVDTPCDDCICLTEKDYCDEKAPYQISLLADAEDGICNFKCCYCVESRHNLHAEKADKYIDVFSLYDELKRRTLLSKSLKVNLGRGELGVLPDREKYFKVFKDVYTVVFTNASVYMEEIHNKLKSATAEMIVSIDAGTRETFRNIRGVDAFDKVIDNLSKYSVDKKGTITLKYIIIPGENDFLKDAIGFAELCGQLSPDMVLLTHNTHVLPEKMDNLQTRQFVNKLMELLESHQLNISILSNVVKQLLDKGSYT